MHCLSALVYDVERLLVDRQLRLSRNFKLRKKHFGHVMRSVCLSRALELPYKPSKSDLEMAFRFYVSLRQKVKLWAKLVIGMSTLQEQAGLFWTNFFLAFGKTHGPPTRSMCEKSYSISMSSCQRTGHPEWRLALYKRTRTPLQSYSSPETNCRLERAGTSSLVEVLPHTHPSLISPMTVSCYLSLDSGNRGADVSSMHVQGKPGAVLLSQLSITRAWAKNLIDIRREHRHPRRVKIRLNPCTLA